MMQCSILGSNWNCNRNYFVYLKKVQNQRNDCQSSHPSTNFEPDWMSLKPSNLCSEAAA